MVPVGVATDPPGGSSSGRSHGGSARAACVSSMAFQLSPWTSSPSARSRITPSSWPVNTWSNSPVSDRTPARTVVGVPPGDRQVEFGQLRRSAGALPSATANAPRPCVCALGCASGGTTRTARPATVPLRVQLTSHRIRPDADSRTTDTGWHPPRRRVRCRDRRRLSIAASGARSRPGCRTTGRPSFERQDAAAVGHRVTHAGFPFEGCNHRRPTRRSRCFPESV